MPTIDEHITNTICIIREIDILIESEKDKSRLMELLQLIEKLIVSIKDATETDVRKCED
jgi:hypothetical protein